MEDLLLFASLAALAYCLYRIRKQKRDIALVVGTAAIYLQYITEQRGALLHLVIEAVKYGQEPPTNASDLEIKVAMLLVSPPTNQREMAALWHYKPRG